MTTTKPTTIAATPPTGPEFRLPDPPEDHESKVTSFIHLAANGNATTWSCTWATWIPPWWAGNAT